MKTMKSEFNDYDNSFTILLFSLFSFVVWFAAAVVWFKNVIKLTHFRKWKKPESISILLKKISDH